MLDQAEIDALLSSVEAENADFDDAGIIQIFSRYRRENEPIELSEYDFRRPERVRRESLQAFEALHQSFARNLSALLTPFLRTMTEVSLAQVEQLTFVEFVTAMPSPTAFAMLQSPALDGPLGLEISPLIAYPMIERLLGGSAEELHIPKRPLTAIESRLVKLILANAASALGSAWAELLHAAPVTLGEIETNPHLAIFASPDELILVARFDVRMQKRGGGMALCMPVRVMEGVFGTLSARGGQFASPPDDSRGSDSATIPPVNGAVRARSGKCEAAIAARLGRARVNVSAVLAETTMTVRRMNALAVGDIIETNTTSREPATLHVEGRPKHLAKIVQRPGSRSVEIVN
jgi:flagellar motor switch protein FliM